MKPQHAKPLQMESPQMKPLQTKPLHMKPLHMKPLHMKPLHMNFPHSIRHLRHQSGSALVEYVVVATALILIWVVYERSPGGLIEALKVWHAQFFWALSVPF